MKKRGFTKILATLIAMGVGILVQPKLLEAADMSSSTSGLDTNYLHWQMEALALRPYLDTAHQNNYSSSSSEPTEVYSDNPGWRAGTSAFTENLGVGQSYGPPEQNYGSSPRWGFSSYGWGYYPPYYGVPYSPYTPPYWW